MFLDRPNNRIKNTEVIRTLIINERVKRDLSATQLAKNMVRPQSWLAQIENGRTKTIKQIDLVYIFSKILNVSEEEADKFLTDNVSKIISKEDSIEKHSFKQMKKYNQFAKSETEEEFKKQKRFIIAAFNSMYEEIPEDAVRILRSFCGNIKYKMPFMMGVASLPFRALEDLDVDVSQEVYNKIAELLMEYANKDKERIKRIETSEDEDDDEEDDWDEEDEDEDDDLD